MSENEKQKIDMVITDTHIAYSGKIRLRNVSFEDMMIIMDYAFKSGYDILARYEKNDEEPKL